MIYIPGPSIDGTYTTPTDNLTLNTDDTTTSTTDTISTDTKETLTYVATLVNAIVVCIGEDTYTEKPGDIDSLGYPRGLTDYIEFLTTLGRLG